MGVFSKELRPARQRCLRVPAAVLVAALSVAVAGAGMADSGIAVASTERAATAEGGYGPTQFQRDLDAFASVGVTGVLGKVDFGERELVGHSGVSDVTTGRPVPDDGYFRMGSNTKTFVATVMLQLVQEGRLSLEDTVERWLPGVVAGNGNDGLAITIKQLLQHTSGLYNYLNDLAVLRSAEAFHQHRFDHFNPEDLVAMAMRHSPEFRPGTSWNYSNTNYVLAGMVIKKVTGQPWYQQVRARILTPLGLAHTFYPRDWPYLPGPHAQGYTQFPGGGPLVDTTDFNPTSADAPGGLVTNADDLTRFWRALRQGELLRPAAMAQMHQTVLAAAWQGFRPGARYGLGIAWFPLGCGGGYWNHGGDLPGFTTFSAVSDDGRRSVVLSMSTQLANLLDGAMKAMNTVDHALCGTG